MGVTGVLRDDGGRRSARAAAAHRSPDAPPPPRRTGLRAPAPHPGSIALFVRNLVGHNLTFFAVTFMVLRTVVALVQQGRVLHHVLHVYACLACTSRRVVLGVTWHAGWNAGGHIMAMWRLTTAAAAVQVVLTKLGFPRLAVAMAVKESAGNLEDSLQILLAVRPLPYASSVGKFLLVSSATPLHVLGGRV